MKIFRPSIMVFGTVLLTISIFIQQSIAQISSDSWIDTYGILADSIR